MLKLGMLGGPPVLAMTAGCVCEVGAELALAALLSAAVRLDLSVYACEDRQTISLFVCLFVCCTGYDSRLCLCEVGAELALAALLSAAVRLDLLNCACEDRQMISLFSCCAGYDSRLCLR